MREVRFFYGAMAFLCLVVALVEMWRGEDVTLLWITYWGMLIMSGVAR